MVETFVTKPALTRALLGLGALLCLANLPSNIVLAQEIDVPVTVTPIVFNPSEPSQTTFGDLEWRGGIEIRSEIHRFGGLSGLIIRDNGAHILGISDVGNWLTAKLIYSDDRIAGLENVHLAPILGTPGEIISGKYETDSEGIGLGIDGNILVSFERYHRIARYDFDAKRTLARATYLAIPDEAENFEDNKGLEAIGQFPAGTLLAEKIIVIAERYLDDDSNNSGWLLGEGDQARLQFARVDDFDITALTILPDGRLILLERSFSILFGPAMRLRLVEQAELLTGSVIEGRELMRADNRETIDNMEGLANHISPEGELLLTLVSDNNFRDFQRTLLMQFALR